MALHPAIEKSLIVAKHEISVTLAEFDGYAEGGERLGHALFPGPQPDRVQMRMANEVNISLHRSYPLDIVSRASIAELQNIV
jgi:hypothetical protein